MPKSFFENKELREKRFETIVNTSLRLFATYGYKKVTIDQITKECHYSHGLFYHYFDTKDSVLKEIENRCNKLFKDEFIKKYPVMVTKTYVNQFGSLEEYQYSKSRGVKVGNKYDPVRWWNKK